ncbi:hypothetical protein EAF00_011082 [Botryotinia globosa]|nr:hypothetical protein EAF00_011082 [Botryotinia globosa]
MTSKDKRRLSDLSYHFGGLRCEYAKEDIKRIKRRMREASETSPTFFLRILIPYTIPHKL